jgi:hypothetical protein
MLHFRGRRKLPLETRKNSPKKLIGKLIEAREKKGFTQEKLASAAAVGEGSDKDIVFDICNSFDIISTSSILNTYPPRSLTRIILIFNQKKYCFP